MCGPCGTLRAIEIKNVKHSTQNKGEIEREKGGENKRGEREGYGERRRLAIRVRCFCLLVADSRRCEEIGWGSLRRRPLLQLPFFFVFFFFFYSCSFFYFPLDVAKFLFSFPFCIMLGSADI